MNPQKTEIPTRQLIEPQYVPPWSPYVESLIRRVSSNDVASIAARLLDEFEAGMCSHQYKHARGWMQASLEATGNSRTSAAERLKVNRGHLGRWLSGDNDIPFQRFQQFYVQIGLAAQLGCPLKGTDTLNLGGYLRALPYLRNALLADLPRYADEQSPSVEAIVCLYHFYAHLDPLEGFMERSPKRLSLPVHVLDDVRETLRTHMPSNAITVGTIADLGRILGNWGASWLLCLRLLAEEADGVTPYYVTARRPIRLVHLFEVDDAAGQ